jgi:hypothetical protein
VRVRVRIKVKAKVRVRDSVKVKVKVTCNARRRLKVGCRPASASVLRQRKFPPPRPMPPFVAVDHSPIVGECEEISFDATPMLTLAGSRPLAFVWRYR